MGKIELDTNDPLVRIQKQLFANVKDMVLNENAVSIDVRERKPDGGERKIVFIINCAENEAKKIVGKAGLTIMALRRLASGTAKKLNIPFPVEVEVFDELLGD